MIRRTVILEEIFKDIATPQERAIVDELYAKRLKGNAVKFMLSKIKKQWDVFMGRGLTEEIGEARTIRITEGGVTRHVARLTV